MENLCVNAGTDIRYLFRIFKSGEQSAATRNTGLRSILNEVHTYGRVEKSESHNHRQELLRPESRRCVDGSRFRSRSGGRGHGENGYSAFKKCVPKKITKIAKMRFPGESFAET